MDASDVSFGRVAVKDEGVYTCRRSYQYLGRLYNHSGTIALKVEANRKTYQLYIHFGRKCLLSDIM